MILIDLGVNLLLIWDHIWCGIWDCARLHQFTPTNTYTKKIFTITRIEGRSYYLDDLQKSYRGHELLKAVGDDLTNEFDTQIEQAKKQEKSNLIFE